MQEVERNAATLTALGRFTVPHHCSHDSIYEIYKALHVELRVRYFSLVQETMCGGPF